MLTTIQISQELKNLLSKRKLYEKETYEEVILDLLENTMELSQETEKDILEARAEIEKGEYFTLEEAKEEIGL